MNNVNLIGRLGSDPEVRYFESGTAVASFNVALDRGKDKTTGEAKPPVWVPIKVWGKSAQNAADLLHKGDKVGISGRLEVEEWTTKNDEKRSKVVVVANRFDLCATATAKAPHGHSLEVGGDEMPF